ncbi:MAG: hypothetical protein RLY93_05530, partial [Sumerlaeia bacterium]
LFRYWDTDHLFGVARRSGPVDQEGMILTYLPGVETPLVENDLSLTHFDIPAGQPFFWRAYSQTFPETGCIAGLGAGQMRLQGLGGWQDYPQIVVPRSSEGIELAAIGEVNEDWERSLPYAFSITIQPWVGESYEQPSIAGEAIWSPSIFDRKVSFTFDYLEGNSFGVRSDKIERESIFWGRQDEAELSFSFGTLATLVPEVPWVVNMEDEVPFGPLSITFELEGYTSDTLFLENVQNYEEYDWRPFVVPDLGSQTPGESPLDFFISNLPATWPAESVQPGLLDILLCTCASETLLRDAADANTDTVHDVADYIRLEVNDL